MLPPLLLPGWPPVPGVAAAMSLRAGGVSGGPWASLNLGLAVGDDGNAVTENRRRYAAALDAQPVWLRQVHGSAVRQLSADAGSGAGAPGDAPGDAAWTGERGIACTVLVADCLPVLFALADGSAVAAAHAGWRGLAGGVLEAALQALCRGRGATAADVQAWIGPCIGPRQFEVGADVLAACGHATDAADPLRFAWRPRSDGAPRWLANLPLLAQDRLRAAGVGHITCEGACTVEDGSRFFSFRRDGVTGRMAASVWRR